MQPSFVPSSPGTRGLPVAPVKRAGTTGSTLKSFGNGAPAGVAAGGLQKARQVAPKVGVAQLGQAAVIAPGFVVGFVGFYIAMHTSFAGEILAAFFGIPFPVVGIFAVIVPLVVLLAGRPTEFFGAPSALPWIFLNTWMAICSVLSFWPRESVTELLPFVLRLQLIPLLICAVATTSRAVGKLLVWTAMGIPAVLILCAVKGVMEEGTRFGIADTSLANPNDLAFHLLWGSTLMAVFLIGRGKLSRILAIAAMSVSFWYILKTASRANFLTLFAVAAVAFLLVAPSVRVLLLFALPIVLTVMLAFLPRATVDRILAVSLTSSASDAAQEAQASGNQNLASAFDSEAARTELARLAVDATLRHPVFGVGMAMFANETADYMMKTIGKKAPWQTAHNSYLKIGSESGIPGLIFYVWSLLGSIAITWRTFKQSRKRPGFEDARRNSICILLALTVYAVGTFFCDIVYLPYMAITVGLAAANFLAFRNEDRLATVLAPISPPAVPRPSRVR